MGAYSCWKFEAMCLSVDILLDSEWPQSFSLNSWLVSPYVTPRLMTVAKVQELKSEYQSLSN